MSAPVLLLPVVLAGIVVGVVLLSTAVRGDRLLPGVALARRHGASTGVVAVVVGLLAAAALVAADPLRPFGPGVSVLAAPVLFALVHSAVVLTGEATWPRPRGAVRSALLSARTPARVAPRALRVLLWTASGLVATVGVFGWATADASGRGLTYDLVDAAGRYAGGGGAGPYPGRVYALPAIVGTVLVLVVVEVGLRLVAQRPAVPAASPTEEALLRRASAHRLLRGACAGVLVVAAGLALAAGNGLSSVQRHSDVGTGIVLTARVSPWLLRVGPVLLGVGFACALAAAVVALLTAPRLRQPARPVVAVGSSA